MKEVKVYEASKMLAKNPNLKFIFKNDNVVTTLQPRAVSWGYDSSNKLDTVGYYYVNLNSTVVFEDKE